MIAAAPMGDPNASIPSPQPVYYRPMFGAFGKARSSTSLTFISQASFNADIVSQLGLQSETAVVKGCRTIGKKDMIHNNYLPKIEVDSQTYEVRADGELLVCEPAHILPMAQRYFLF